MAQHRDPIGHYFSSIAIKTLTLLGGVVPNSTPALMNRQPERQRLCDP